MIAVGIDPGVGVSHVAVVQDQGDALTALDYGLLETHPHDPQRLRGGVAQLTLVLVQLSVAAKDTFVAVETARGEVFKGRSADGPLQNNLVAGQLLGALSRDFYAVSMPPSGAQLGFNWRDYLLSSHKDADAGLQVALAGLLKGLPLPQGPRGGRNSHYADAAGVAVAALLRCRQKGITAPHELGRFYELSGLEAAQQGGVKTRRADRKSTRRLKGTYGDSGSF